jgi:hypothetical protein
MRILAAEISVENSEAFDKAERLLVAKGTLCLTSSDELGHINYQATIRTKPRTQPDSDRSLIQAKQAKNIEQVRMRGFLAFYLAFTPKPFSNCRARGAGGSQGQRLVYGNVVVA